MGTKGRQNIKKPKANQRRSDPPSKVDQAAEDIRERQVRRK